MPFVLIILGLILFVTAIKGTTGQLGTLLGQDVFGTHGYIYWLVAIFVIGAVGYIKPLKGLSDAFVVLLLIVLLLASGKPGSTGGGFFKQFQAALGQVGQPQATSGGQTGASPSGAVSGVSTNLLSGGLYSPLAGGGT